MKSYFADFPLMNFKLVLKAIKVSSERLKKCKNILIPTENLVSFILELKYVPAVDRGNYKREAF